MKEVLLYGGLGGVIGSLFMGWVYAPTYKPSLSAYFAVVDLHGLIARKSQQLAKVHVEKRLFPQGQLSLDTLRIQEAADLLKEDLNAFAKTHQLVLLSKHMVVGGDLPDKTPEILALIEEKEDRP